MNTEYIEKIRNDLVYMADEKYKTFNIRLIPTVDETTVLGVRVPQLRSYSAKLFKEGEYEAFLKDLPHKYFEENHLHSFLICKIKDFDCCINELDNFLHFVDNWSVCDSMKPVCFAANKDRLLTKIRQWIKSDEPYIVRFAIEMLMTHFLDSDFRDEYFELVLSVKSDEYYVNMMIAWYFATALAKRYDMAVRVIEEKRLPLWVHNKTIQKAVESYRISEEKKNHLKLYKIKN